MKWRGMLLRRAVKIFRLVGMGLAALLLAGGCSKGVRYMDLAVSHPPNNAALQGIPLRSVDAVVATVASTAILFSEVIAMGNLPAEGPRDARWKEIFDAVLEQLILQTLSMEYLKMNGDAVSEEELANALRDIKTNHGILSDEDFRKKVESSGTTMTQFRQNVTRMLAYQKCVRNVLGSYLDVTDAQVQQEYERRKRSEIEWPLQRILIPYSASTTEQEKQRIRTRLEAARAAVMGGTPFAAVARGVEGGDSVTKEGGDMGWVENLASLEETIQKAVRPAKVGQWIGPLDVVSLNSIQLLRVVETRQKSLPPFEEAKKPLRDEMVRVRILTLQAFFRNQLTKAISVKKIPLAVPNNPV